jgi:hypothetical protein
MSHREVGMKQLKRVSAAVVLIVGLLVVAVANTGTDVFNNVTSAMDKDFTGNYDHR